jgi:hypothetical protein
MLSSLLAALLLCGCTGFLRGVQGSGVPATETRDVATFRSLDLLSGVEQALVTIGDKTEVIVEADDNIVPLIHTEVNNDTLRVLSKESYSSRLGVKLRITTPALEAVSLAGSGDVQVFKLQEKRFAVHIAGSGTVKAEGSAEQVQASISGSGNIDLSAAAAKKGSADITGSGNVKVNVADSLSAKITGSGDIYYKGHPRVEQQITGSGRVGPY